MSLTTILSGTIPTFFYAPVKLHHDATLAKISLGHLNSPDNTNDFVFYNTNATTSPKAKQLRLPLLLYSSTYAVGSYFLRLLIHGGIHSTATQFTRWQYGNNKTNTGGAVRNLFSTLLTQCVFYPLENEASQYLCCQRYFNKPDKRTDITAERKLHGGRDGLFLRTWTGFGLIPMIELGKNCTFFLSQLLLNKYVLQTIFNEETICKNIAATFTTSCAVVLSAAMWYPVQTVRRAMVMQEVPSQKRDGDVVLNDAGSVVVRIDYQERKYTMWTFTKHLYKTKGIKGFYDGFAQHANCSFGLLRLVPLWLETALNLSMRYR